ncbi:MAG TPA: 5-(carboxyamino)imidazole ribonucleotide synthase [Gemmatimonadales bacterium]|jgi:5-(carboxyamino)imidazole ribonucleotide synthase|nr:5-(carboxyamino)imidazole ribonucleotide synthase [Gemmatimonadales bacterium]
MLGVLGGGQLGRMFTAEARRMGYRVAVVDPDPDAPAAQIANRHIARHWTDVEALTELAESCAAVTTEFENVPADVLRALAAHVPVRPAADAVAATQDRLDEKAFLNGIGIATAEWAPIRGEEHLASAWPAIGGVAGLLKTARMGYDGKGQAMVTSADRLATAYERLGGVPCILERRVALEREISVMVARGADGCVVTWPVGENVHKDGILHTTVVPAMVSPAIAEEARRLAERIVTALDYVGVMGVECFVADGGKLLINELAPRPHNSGHWTLDASATSQFEQQVRILAELPLGDTRAITPVAMVNILGDLWSRGEPDWPRALAIPGVRLHLYGKREPRPGRKMGHLTAVADDPLTALELALEAWSALGA